jgi:hypothetical protein
VRVKRGSGLVSDMKKPLVSAVTWGFGAPPGTRTPNPLVKRSLRLGIDMRCTAANVRTGCCNLPQFGGGRWGHIGVKLSEAGFSR